MEFSSSASKERYEYLRLNEIETYFAQQKAPEMTLIGLSIIVGLYLDETVAVLLIGLSLFKLMLLILYSVIEHKAYECTRYPVTARASQFWIYRIIFLLQLLLLFWILFEVTRIRKTT